MSDLNDAILAAHAPMMTSVRLVALYTQAANETNDVDTGVLFPDLCLHIRARIGTA